jgi:hypothetical protein
MTKLKIGLYFELQIQIIKQEKIFLLNYMILFIKKKQSTYFFINEYSISIIS